jgi:shikimate dehydrogenase
VKALKQNGVNLAGKKVLLLGAGGAAKAVAFCLANEVDQLCILNRDGAKARELASALSLWGKRVVGGELIPSQIKQDLRDSDVLINATSVGMAPNVHESLVELPWLKQDLCVMDLVYTPVETQLIQDARTAGAKVINGVEMLLYQGAASFEIWMSCKAPVEVMREALLSKLSTAGAAV